MLIEAGQPEILRAVQRDEAFKKKLKENFFEILQSVMGVRLWIKYKETANIFSNILYEIITTMSNLQTLGEEYTGLIQVNSSKNSTPKKYVQFLMIMLDNCGEKVLVEVCNKFENILKKLPKEHPIQVSARIKLIEISTAFKICLPLIIKLHKALFYFNGGYYEMGKRFCGIKYILVRYWMKNRSSVEAFKLLGIVSFLHVALCLLSKILSYKSISLEREETIKVVDKPKNNYDKCSLCLNVRQHTSVTPCGHLFCWSCIISWLQDQPKCPLCRQVFLPSRVVYLQNYENYS